MSFVRTEPVSLLKMGVVLDKTVTLVIGAEGHMPTVLVDPVDVCGLQVPGLWLGDGDDGHRFHWTERFCPECHPST